MATIQTRQRVIRALLENFDWETDPNWRKDLDIIINKIHEYWIIDKKFQGKRKPKGIP